RTTAAHRHRPRRRRRPSPDPRRRADRGPRLGHGRGRHEDAAHTRRRGGRGPARHARRPPRGLGRSDRLPARRPSRRRVAPRRRRVTAWGTTMSGPRMTRSTFPDPRPPEQRERGGMLRWRMALKMSMRQSLKSWPSSVLVVLLVLLPMAGVAAAAVYAESLSPSAQQRVDAELGEADAWVQARGMPSGVRQYLDDPNAQFEYDAASSHDWIEPPADVADVIDADRLVRIELGSAAVETVAGIGAFQVVLGETWDPL